MSTPIVAAADVTLRQQTNFTEPPVALPSPLNQFSHATDSHQRTEVVVRPNVDTLYLPPHSISVRSPSCSPCPRRIVICHAYDESLDGYIRCAGTEPPGNNARDFLLAVELQGDVSPTSKSSAVRPAS